LGAKPDRAPLIRLRRAGSLSCWAGGFAAEGDAVAADGGVVLASPGGARMGGASC